MSRLPSLSYDQLDADGQRVWDHIVDTRGDRVILPGGEGLSGPFNALVTAPHIGGHLSALGATLRFNGTLPDVLRELAICVVAGHWQAEFEWAAHSRLARELGVPDTVLDAIAQGGEPEFADDAQRTVYTVARQLVQTGRVTPETDKAVRQLLGGSGTVELVSLCGYYCAVAFSLNTFDVPLPPGVQPTWEDADA
jgi:4-carboxymuconolactone decarboxylase